MSVVLSKIKSDYIKKNDKSQSTIKVVVILTIMFSIL